MDIPVDSRDALESWITDWLTQELNLDRSQFSTTEPLLSYGINSVQAMMLVGDLENRLGKALPPTLVWDYPTIDALAAHLAENPLQRVEGAPVQRVQLPSELTQETAKALLSRLDELSEDQVEELLRRYAPND